MIRATFESVDGKMRRFAITGHAGWAAEGKDILCAAVSSAVQLAANTVTDAAHLPAQVTVKENTIEVSLPDDRSGIADIVFRGLSTHLIQLGEDFAGTIEVEIREAVS